MPFCQTRLKLDMQELPKLWAEINFPCYHIKLMMLAKQIPNATFCN